MATTKSDSKVSKPKRPIEKAHQHLAALIAGAVPVVFVKCVEEARFESQLARLCVQLTEPAEVVSWSITEGVFKEVPPKRCTCGASYRGGPQQCPACQRTLPQTSGEQYTASGALRLDDKALTPTAGIEWAMRSATGQLPSLPQPTPRIVVLRDFGKLLQNDKSGILLRRLRDAVRTLRSAPICTRIVVLGTVATPPDDVRPEVGYVEWPLPDDTDVAAILDAVVQLRSLEPLVNGERERVIRAALGLTVEQMSNAFCVSIAEHGKIETDAVLKCKAEEFKKQGLLYWEPDPTLEVGGLERLVGWLKGMRKCFSADAATYGLTPPKGVLITGQSGTGKTLTAKVTSQSWGLPMILLRATDVMGSHVGESEAKLEAALTAVGACAPCILLVDEIDKWAAGAGKGAASDGGTHTRVIGRFLTWMSEQSGVFVVATANNVIAMLEEMPELASKHRFAETFYCDLPTTRERKQIVAVHVRRVKRDPANFDLDALAQATEAMTGAEIEAAVQQALLAAFQDDKREVTTADVVTACERTVPLSKRSAMVVQRLREWARTAAVPASLPDESEAAVDAPPDMDVPPEVASLRMRQGSRRTNKN